MNRSRLLIVAALLSSCLFSQSGDTPNRGVDTVNNDNNENNQNNDNNLNNEFDAGVDATCCVSDGIEPFDLPDEFGLALITVENPTATEVENVPVFIKFSSGYSDPISFEIDENPIPHEQMAEDAFWISIPKIGSGETVFVDVVSSNTIPESPWGEYELVVHFDGNSKNSSPVVGRDGSVDPPSTPGVFGPSADFTQSNEALSFEGFPGLVGLPGEEISISFWMQVRTDNQDAQAVLDLRRSCQGLSYNRRPGNELRITHITDEVCGELPALAARNSDSQLGISRWEYVGVEIVRDARSFETFFSGTSTSRSLPEERVPGTAGDNPIFVGGGQTNVPFMGQIDELRISNRARGEAWHELQFLLGVQPGLVTIDEFDNP